MVDTIGYYYYKDGEAPTSYDQLKNRAIVIVPNALSRNTDASGTQDACGMSPNTTVQLKYYGEYNTRTKKYANEDNGGSYQFPVGTRIGFVLYANAWTNRAHSGDRLTRAATSQECCVYGNGEAQKNLSKPLTAVFGINGFVVISFEDDILTQTGAYTDCIFTTKSNPIDALDVQKVESTTSENTENIGVYAFEDQWPKVGDYDMNDVMIDVSRTQTLTDVNKTNNNGSKTKTYGYASETFNVTTHHNYATLDNHWAMRLKGVATNLTSDNIMVTKDGESMQCTITKEGNDYIVQMESIDASTDHKYAISLMWAKTYNNYDERSRALWDKTQIEVFANRPIENWEVHIPYEAPTKTMDMTLFGTQNDGTIINSNGTSSNWYTRAGEYPFAFFLSGATHTDISPLLDSDNESTPINELYPNFFKWVDSKGKNNKNWYKAE